MIIKSSNKVNNKLLFEKVKEKYNNIYLSEKFIKNHYGDDFILHFGPPYANGEFHCGHLLNAILKDFVIREKIILGKKIKIIFGSDCHGLPIEKNVEEIFAQLQNKQYTVDELRKQCYIYANQYSEIHRRQIAENKFITNQDYYQTNSREYISNVIKALFKINEYGLIVKDKLPVYYSIEEKTNLAYSEILYAPVEHYAVYFTLPLCNTRFRVLIYTTQIWTLLGNEMLCINDNINYITFKEKDFHIITSEKFAKDNKIYKYSSIDIKWLLKQKYITPFSNEEKLIFTDSYVGNEGTGILHIAPAHGKQDKEIFRKYYNKEIKNCIDKNGYLIHEELKDWSIVDNDKNANTILIQILSKKGFKWKEEKIIHNYPISWRNKKPLYMISTDQVIINIGKNNIEYAIEIAKESNWYGNEGIESFLSTLEKRDTKWCISRQRKNGTPLTFYYNKNTDEIINNKELNKEIITLIDQHGPDFWFKEQYNDALKFKYFGKNENILPIKDTLDVWFDSGYGISYFTKSS